jgi:hypothetical protein
MAQKSSDNLVDSRFAKILSELGEMTLKKYLIHAADVKYCPTEGC